MLDFTSALYLDLHHASGSLPGWDSLTLGKPAALEEPPGAASVEIELARLTGFDAALLGASTLHMFLDLFALLGGPRAGIFLDQGSYPIARWGSRMAGLPAYRFPRHDSAALEHLLRRSDGVRPVIVSDGLCPTSGAVAPLAEYRRLAIRRGGLVVIDDTQALGILGTSPQSARPYGVGGGGSLRYAGLGSRGFVVVSSLAKAFGVPVAMIGGSAAIVARFRERSLTRVHCSPPSAAVIAAAARALEVNRRCGDSLRARVARRVDEFLRGLSRLRLRAGRSLFPVQRLRLPGPAARDLNRALLDRGVRAVLQRGGVSFLLTAGHRPAEIEQAIDILAEARRFALCGTTTGVYGYDESA